MNIKIKEIPLICSVRFIYQTILQFSFKAFKALYKFEFHTCFLLNVSFSSLGSGAATLLQQCKNCNMTWNLFLVIICPTLGVSKDYTREFSSQYDSNVGFLITLMLKLYLGMPVSRPAL